MVRVALLQPNVQTPVGANDVYTRNQPGTNTDAETAASVSAAFGAVAGAVNSYEAVKTQQDKLDAAAWSANTTSAATLTWQQKLQDSKLTAPAGAPDFTKNTIEDFDKFTQDQLANAPDKFSKQYLTQQLASLRTRVGSEAITFEGQQKVKWREDQFTEASQNAANAAFANPKQADQLIADVAIPLMAMDMPGDWKNEQLRKVTQAVNLAAATSVARTDPASIVGQPGQGANAVEGGQYSAGFTGADAFVAGKEGGYTGNDNNHGPTNFGINSAANPDLDVSKLTPEQAAQVRKTRYWDAIHADSLPPSLQPVAYNFAIQAGPGAANNLLQKAGGDPDKFNDLAKAYYAGIPADKANGNLPGWQQRSDQALALGKGAGASADNEYLSKLPYTARLTVFQQAKSQQQQDMSQWQARIDAGLADRQAAAQQGISDPTPLTMPILLKAYPPDIAAQKYTQYMDGQQLARDVSSVKNMPSDQISSLVSARAPVAGPGYAAAQHDQQILQSAAASVLQQRNSDPSAYVSKNAFAVQNAQAAFASNPTPENAQGYARASIAEQQRLGIPKPQVLTNLQATTIEDQIKANNGLNADAVIQQQAAMWGPHWGDVFGQLKDIPPVAKVLGYLGDSVPTSTRQQIMQASQVKIEALKDGLNPANTKAAETRLQDLTKDFAATMTYSVGGAQTFSALYDSADRLSLTYQRQGMAPGDAAATAFKNIIGSQFNVVGAARIPVSFDKDKVMQGASQSMTNLSNLDLMTPPAPSTLKASEVKQKYVDNLKSNAKWVTSADGKGLVLYDPVSSTIVRTKDGRPVGSSFTELATPPTPPVAQADTNVSAIPDTSALGGGL